MFGHAAHRRWVFVMAAALLLLSGGEGGARASATFGPSFVTAGPIAGQKIRLISMCRAGGVQSNSMTGMVCSAHCAVASGLLPTQPALPAIAPTCPLPSLTLALEDYRPSPDPHPPKPTLLG
jgi:hypothetical protein